MVSHHSAKFGGYRHFGGGDMILVVEEQDSTFSRLNPPFCLFLNCMVRKYMSYHVNKCDIGHAPKAEIEEKYTTFVSPCHKGVLNERNQNKKGYLKAFCITRKRNKGVLYFLKC